MSNLGDFDPGTVIHDKFTTYRPSTGAPYGLSGTPAISIYKDAGTAQSTTGVSLTPDFDGVIGLNHYTVDTSADGTFYSSGSFYCAIITTGTVDSVSAVGTVVGRWTLRKNSALKPATAGRTLVVDAAGLADANVVKVGPTGSGTAQTAADLATSLSAVSADTIAIRAKTNNLPTDSSATYQSMITTLSAVSADTIAIRAKTVNLPADTNASLSAVSADTIAIRAKTSSLNFTVAGQVDSNIQYVNDVEVAGTGASGDTWGPA